MAEQLVVDGAACPLNGDICPGVEACAPALFKRNYADADIDIEFEVPTELMCPIVDGLHSLMLAASGLLPFVGGGAGEDDVDDTTEEQRREKVIESLKLD